VSLAGSAIIAIWNDITPELRDAFFEWHPREHMNERLGIPGFLRGSRYIALTADIEFFTLYEAASADVLVSPAYKKRLNAPTPWSLQVLPGFRNNLRGVCNVVFSRSVADGGFLFTARFDADPKREAELNSALSETILPELLDKPKITGVHLAICDQDLSGTNTSLQRGRSISTPRWIVMLEGSDASAVKAAAAVLEGGTLLDHGAKDDAACGLYQLEYSISRLTVAEEPG
jgi:hypothetical protein